MWAIIRECETDTMFLKTAAIGGVGMLGMAGTAVVDLMAQPEASNHIEKLGIAAVTIVILLYLLREANGERREQAKAIDSLNREIRTTQAATIDRQVEASRNSAEALREQARATHELTGVLKDIRK